MSIPLTIIIVTYNSSQYLGELLNDINESEAISNVEVIIVDNNSTDKSKLKNIINIGKTKFKNISIRAFFRTTNAGFASSCNYGSKYSNGEKILFLNPDTRLSNNALKNLINHMNKHNAQIGGSKVLFFNKMGIHRTIFNKPSLKTFILEFSNLGKILNINSKFYINQRYLEKDIFVDGVGGACLCIDRVIFNKLNGFDESFFMYLEDVDLCVRAISENHKIIYCPHSYIYHVGGASSNNKYHIHHQAWYNSRLTYLNKHFGFFITIILTPILRVEEFLLKLRTKIYGK